MARGVNQVEQVSLTIFGVSVYHGSCLCKNCYASLSFDCKSVKYLRLTLFQLLYCVCHFEHAVSQSRLTMVDVCNYREVTDAFSWDRRQQGLVNIYFLLLLCSCARKVLVWVHLEDLRPGEPHCRAAPKTITIYWASPLSTKFVQLNCLVELSKIIGRGSLK